MIWSVPKSWKGETCFILAGGPSLRGFDAEPLRGHGFVIAINDSWRLCPWADVFYFCDAAWWDDQIIRNRVSMDGTISFHELMDSGFWVTGSVAFPTHPRVRQLLLTGQKGMEADPRGLKHGSNSGYQAINLAYHFGVSRIVLLGYDMRVSESGTHWHDEPRPQAFDLVLSRTMLPLFQYLIEPLKQANVKVINATPNSALSCWPYRPLAEILKPLSAAAL